MARVKCVLAVTESLYQMDATYQLDPELLAFRDATRRILRKFNDGTREPPRLARSFRPGGESGRGIFDAVGSQIDTYSDILDGLTREMEMLATGLATGNADGARVFATMGKVEAYLDILRAECLKIRSWRVERRDAVARNALASAYEHTLGEVLDWLQNVDDTLTDPFDTLKKQGRSIPDTPETSHRVRAGENTRSDSEAIDIPLVLTLTEAPELSAIERWAERRGRKTRRNRSGGMTEGLLLGGFLGWLLGEMGDDE